MANACKVPGVVAPIVDATRCEGKRDCVDVCPYGVFDVRRLTDDERQALPWLSRFKVAVHGGRQAFVVKPADCHNCGKCVTACPERAITLAPYQAR